MLNMEVSQLSVALLLSEIEDVKEITQVFKKLGIVPHFYEDLKTFWIGTIERVPSLAIIDVKKMSENGLILREHPVVKAEEMPLLFFYNDKTEPLMVSTEGLYHLGSFKKTTHSYEGTFKALLKRINKFITLEQENNRLKINLEIDKEKILKLEDDKRKMVKADFYHGLIKSMAQKIENDLSPRDFQSTLEVLFDEIDEIEEFSSMELNFNGQKLMSPLSYHRKFRSIPSLWLGQVCQNGIEPFALNMANQVALEVLGGNIICLMIKGPTHRTEQLIFVKSSDEVFFNHFEWSMLELILTGIYANFKLVQNIIKSENKNINSTFDAFQFLDQFVVGKLPLNNKGEIEDMRLVNVDLSNLSRVLLKKGTQQFYWKKFRDDFISKVTVSTRKNFRFFENGVTDLSFLVNKEDLDLFFDELKECAERFPYWKYFENSEINMYQDLRPKVHMIPLSAYAYLKNIKEREEIHLLKGNKDIIESQSKIEKVQTNLTWDKNSEL